MAITHIQSNAFPGHSGGSPNYTFVPEGFPNPTAGARMLCCLAYFQNSGDPARTITALLDQSSNPITFLQYAGAPDRYLTDTGGIMFDIPVMPSGVTAIVPVFSSAPAFGSRMNYSEYSGCDALAAQAASSLSASAGTGTDAVLTGAASNTSQPCLLWASAFDSIFNTLPAAGTGFNDRVGGTEIRTEDLIITSVGLQQGSFTNTGGTTRNHMAFMALIGAAGGGGGGPPTIMLGRRKQTFVTQEVIQS